MSNYRIETTGTAQIRHKDTSEVFELTSDELDWEPVFGHERDMGRETLWNATVDHPELGELRWEFSEYPEGFKNAESNKMGGHEVLQNFDISFGFEPEEPDEPLDAMEFDSDAAAEEMREWFLSRYEDPAKSLPYVSAEGGYQWINGGPYDALEILGEQFENEYGLELVEKVAKSIVDESGIWDWSPVLGSDFYGEDLTDLDQATLLQKSLPYSEELVINQATGAFDIVPVPITNQVLLEATLGQISDALDDILSSPSNGLNEDALEVRRLQRTLDRYRNDPQRVEMDLTSVHGSLVNKIASEELPPSDENNALVTALREGAQGIRATYPSVAENREILSKQALLELSDEDQKTISDAAPLLEAITEGTLKEQIQEDIRYLTQELPDQVHLLPGVTREDALLPGKDEKVRLFSRVSKMFIQLKSSDQIVDKIRSSSGYKALEIFAVFGSLISLFLTLLL